MSEALIAKTPRDDRRKSCVPDGVPRRLRLDHVSLFNDRVQEWEDFYNYGQLHESLRPNTR